MAGNISKLNKRSAVVKLREKWWDHLVLEKEESRVIQTTHLPLHIVAISPSAFLRDFRSFKSVFILWYSKIQIIATDFVLGNSFSNTYTAGTCIVLYNVFSEMFKLRMITKNRTLVDKKYLEFSIVSLIAYLVHNDKAFCYIL